MDHFLKSLCWIRYNIASVVLLLLLFSRSVMADSLRPQGLQHARLPCPSSTPGVCSNSCPLSQWCRSTICSSVAPFSSCPQSFPASVFSNESSGGQNIGASASASVLAMNIQGGLHSVFFFFWPGSIQDLGSLTSDWTCKPCIRRLSVNHWTARKVP